MAALKWVVHTACNILGHQNPSPNPNPNSNIKNHNNASKGYCSSEFKLPVHYPRYSKSDYESMEEWRLDVLLQQYGLSFHGSVEEKRVYAKGTFLWDD